MTPQPFASERDEIAKIDYLLDNLARAVERGEVHRASYDLMAPRYLERRAELAAVVSGANRVAAAGGAAATTAPTSGTVPSPLTPGAPINQPFPVPAESSRPRRESKPVKWTTVLTLLGAFLVIAASAIFAVVVWDLMSVGGKLAFMGTLTVGFYAGGWYARRLGLRLGGTALITVASAMLLFLGWIVIDGYNLEGPLPWAVLLLVCSAAYWYTEILLADRFFGVIGAAAQLGWWWLLGMGLGLTVPARLAGMALVVLAWQIAAERGRGNETLGSLALMLEWCAPIAAAILAVPALLGNLALVRSADVTEVAAAAVVCTSASMIAYRSRLLAHDARRWIAAAAQLPLIAYLLVAWGTTGATWGLVAIAVVMVLEYDLAAMVSAGLPFAVLGVASELGLVVLACDVLDVGPRVTVAVAAALAALWAAGSRLAEPPAVQGQLPRLDEVRVVAEVASFVLLVVTSVSCIAVGDGVALLGYSLPAEDVVLAFGVLAAWCAAATVLRNPVFAFGGSIWSFYALAALMSRVLPDQRAEVYALGITGLAAVWLASGNALEPRYGALWREVTRAVARATIFGTVLVGVAWGMADGWDGSWWPCALAAAAAAVCAVDAVANSSRVSSALAGVLAVMAGALAGGTITHDRSPLEGDQWWAVTGTLSGAAIAGTMAALGRRARRLAAPAAVAATCAATIAVIPALDQHALTEASLAMLAVAWGFSAFLTTQWLMLPAGICAYGVAVAFCAYNADNPTATALVLSATGVILGVFAFTRPGGPGGRLAKTGQALAVAGLTGSLVLVLTGFVAESIGADGWYAIGLFGISGALAVIGAHVIAQAIRWRLEPALYAGGLALLLAIWTYSGSVKLSPAEFYTTPLALYLVACGYVRKHQHRDVPYPVALDALAVIVGLGYPLMLGLTAPQGAAATHALWVLGLSLVAIAGGIVAKSRWYFFGGVGALAAVAGYRSFVLLAEFWWILLGLVGIAMLVIALTWERQRSLVADTRHRLRRSFEDWR